MTDSRSPQVAAERAAAVVILAGVSAALHIAKLPPAIAALQAGLGISLLQAGFLLSLVQAAGMTAGVAFGVLADGLGLKRSMLIGLTLLATASALGPLCNAVPMLMALRALEGFGFLLVVLPAPGLVRRLVPPQRLSRVLGLWGTYMPSAPPWPCWSGRCDRRLRLACVVVAVGRAVAGHGRVAGACRAGPARPDAQTGAADTGWWQRLRQTLSAPGPWLVAMTSPSMPANGWRSSASCRRSTCRPACPAA